MSRQLRWFGASLLVFALVIGMNPIGVSGGGKGKDKKTPLSAIEALVLASKLEDLGKVTKSPVTLLAAAELYWSIVPDSMEELKDVKVVTEEAKDGEKGDPAGEVKKTEDPRKLAKKLFDMAQEYAAPNEKDGVTELIKGIKGTLGSTKGPHSVHMCIAGKANQHLTFHFVGNQIAHLGFRCNTGAPLQIHFKGKGVTAQDYCVNGSSSWLPTGAGSHPVTVHVHNPHKQAMHYVVWVN